jgi:thymidylate kinase
VTVVLPDEDQALVAQLPESVRRRNGVPDLEDGEARERAAEIVRVALGDVLQPGGLRSSVLGPAWSRDLDLHVDALPDPDRLAGLGWVRLDGLLECLGHRGAGRWAVVEDKEVLGLADLTTDVPPDPVRSVLNRCKRRAEVRVREVLELRALVRSGAELPEEDPALGVAAGVEAGLSGDLLRRWRRGPALPAPAALTSSRWSRPWPILRRLGARLRPRRRVVVAISGIDGGGKSTLTSLLARDLRRVGLPVTQIWTRPGMRLRWLKTLGGFAKRLLGQNPAPGVQRIGGGERTEALASRRGPLGWTWSFLVTLVFVRDVWREHRRGRGILLYDRHLLDALVTLDVVYGGVRLGLHRALVRRLVPRADLTLLLRVPPSTAHARKPADMFGEAVLERQAQRYAALRSEASHLRELDGTRPPHELAAEAFRLVAGIGPLR